MNVRSSLAVVLCALGACNSPERGAAPSVTASASARLVTSAPVASSEIVRVPTAPSVSLAPIASVTTVHRERVLAWRQLDLVNWQAVADDLPELPPEPSFAPSVCPGGMSLVEGEYLLDKDGRDDGDGVMLAQNQACAFFRTADHGINALCDRFDRAAWLRAVEGYPRRHLRVCVDRYEYPNRRGEFPLVVVTYAESRLYCAKAGKRLCTESEWTFACEGDEGLPYPYGYERDASACNIGVMGPGPLEDTFSPRTTEHTARGVDFSFRGKRSGESSRCVSPFGVFDLTGNVDEWTHTVRKYGYEMIMKGGHWGPARQRCRPQTRGHGPHYVRYDQGFRCCQDAPSR